jgi:hypothetical protein
MRCCLILILLSSSGAFFHVFSSDPRRGVYRGIDMCVPGGLLGFLQLLVFSLAYLETIDKKEKQENEIKICACV